MVAIRVDNSNTQPYIELQKLMIQIALSLIVGLIASYYCRLYILVVRVYYRPNRNVL